MFKGRYILIIVLVILIILVSAGLVFTTILQKNAQPEQPAVENIGTSSLNNGVYSYETTDVLNNPFRTIVESSTAPVKCTFLADIYVGTVYSDSGKAILSYKEINSPTIYHLLIDETNAFVWKEKSTSGLKSPRELIFSKSPDRSLLPLGGLNPTGNIDFQCEESQFPKAVFDLPENVAFTNYNPQ